MIKQQELYSFLKKNKRQKEFYLREKRNKEVENQELATLEERNLKNIFQTHKISQHIQWQIKEKIKDEGVTVKDKKK